MNKTMALYLFTIFVCVITFDSCVQKDSNRAYFKINPNDRKILVPVQMDDNITGNLVFDTFYSLVLDSAFCTGHPSISFYNNENTAKELQSGVFWSSKGMRTLLHETPQAIKIGNSMVEYNHVLVYDLKNYMNNNELDGVFNIPQSDSVNVWELNFEHNYIEIHHNEQFRMPKNCFILPMDDDAYGDKMGEKNTIKIQLPMQIQFADSDTLTMNRIYYIDTGMAWDIVLMHKAEEIEIFNKRNDAVWTEDANSYYRHYEVKATLFDSHIMDSLRIYTFDRPTGIGDKYIIGTNFLKRFNVFFDMKNRLVGLQPIKNFQRIINPLRRRYYYSTMQTPEGRIIITKVADYESNYYKAAGLQKGDEIVTVNGKTYKDITREERWEFHTKDTLIFDIKRDEKPLKLVVHVNKNEEQGD